MKRGPLSKNRKNRLDLVNIKAKRQPPANPHHIQGSAGTPCPPQTISGLTQSGLGLERNHEASNEVPILRLARGPTRKASDEVPILRLARGPARKASDEVPILRLARGPAPRGLG